MARLSYRQGDVMLVPVSDIPEPTTSIMPENGRLILARGEVTGHHHSVAVADAEMVRGANEPEAIYLRIMTATPLEHQEHAPITLEPGTYRVTRQREYTPAAPVQVAD